VGTHGTSAAAITGWRRLAAGYFGVSPARLTWPQAALLAGLMPAPSVYNPIANFAIARSREKHVLGRLVATGRLTQAQADWAYHQRLHLVHGRTARCQEAI
jgi:membrane peptidoglycan carboxypeptidase